MRIPGVEAQVRTARYGGPGQRVVPSPSLCDLPTSTKSPDLDDLNMRTLLKGHEDKGDRTVSDVLVARYVSWLILVEFLPKPSLPGADLLPELGNSSVRKALGRSGA